MGGEKRREISLCAGRRIRRSECEGKSRPAPFEMTGGRERAGRGKVETRRQKLEIGKERTETPHSSRGRASGAKKQRSRWAIDNRIILILLPSHLLYAQL